MTGTTVPPTPQTERVSVRTVIELWNRVHGRWMGDDRNRYVYIGRTSPYYGFRASIWANPFHLEEHGNSRLEVCRKYEAHIREKMALHLVDIERLRGKILVCHCDTHEMCHGDVLLMLLGELNLYEAAKRIDAETPKDQLRLF